MLTVLGDGVFGNWASTARRASLRAERVLAERTRCGGGTRLFEFELSIFLSHPAFAYVQRPALRLWSVVLTR